MSDDFGTVTVRRGAAAREIEVLRERYRQHRDSLMRLVSDAPTEHLAVEYQRLVRDVDVSLAKLDELEGRGIGAAPFLSPAARVAIPNPRSAASTAADARASIPVVPPGSPKADQVQGDPLHDETEPGARPLVPAPGVEASDEAGRGAYDAPANPRSRMLLIAFVAIVVLAVMGGLIWRASSDRKEQSQPTSTAAAVTESAPATITPVTPAPKTLAALVVAPAVVDFGTVAKGTRAARQVEIANNGTAPITIEVSRSLCRCLYYEYAGQVAPKKRETITVTVDGTRAKAGTLDETITVTAKKDPSIATNFQVTGTVK